MDTKQTGASYLSRCTVDSTLQRLVQHTMIQSRVHFVNDPVLTHARASHHSSMLSSMLRLSTSHSRSFSRAARAPSSGVSAATMMSDWTCEVDSEN